MIACRLGEKSNLSLLAELDTELSCSLLPLFRLSASLPLKPYDPMKLDDARGDPYIASRDSTDGVRWNEAPYAAYSEAVAGAEPGSKAAAGSAVPPGDVGVLWWWWCSVEWALW